ncbi:MAG: AraC family transcriptional regulator [Steroidobacteraceae bacterium]
MTKALTRDVLTSILRTLRLRVRLMSRGDYCGQWALDSGERNKATFHLVGRGELWMHCASRDEALLLREDDLLVFHRPQWHQFSCSAEKQDRVSLGRQPRRKDEPVTTVICCVVEFEAGAHNLVLGSLPEMSVVQCRQHQASAELVALARHMMSEHDAETPGYEAVMERLAEALFIEVMRHHMRGGNEHGLLRALADPQLGQALSALHAEPGRDWDVATLARIAAMSRSHFARRFAECLETTPMHYLAEWRMQLANELLRDPRQSVARVAETLGFQTEATFRRAFKRLRQIGPGSVRREARQ